MSKNFLNKMSVRYVDAQKENQTITPFQNTCLCFENKKNVEIVGIKQYKTKCARKKFCVTIARKLGI